MPDRPRVTRQRDVLDGVPCVEGTRIPAATIVLVWRDLGWKVNGPKFYPDLTDDQVLAAVAYWRRWGWWWEARRWTAERLVDVAGWLMRGVW